MWFFVYVSRAKDVANKDQGFVSGHINNFEINRIKDTSDNDKKTGGITLLKKTTGKRKIQSGCVGKKNAGS